MPTDRSFEDDDISLDAPRSEPDRDGVSALRDTEAEAGDEEELDDLFELDAEEARELGTNLDRIGGEEPLLD